MSKDLENEYDVYYHKYAGAMSDETVSDDAEVQQEDTEAVETKDQENTPVQLDGYKTIFDIKVSLTPIELVPVNTYTK